MLAASQGPDCHARNFESDTKSALSASISLSNIYFFKKNDYFSPSAEEIPLLHTWSLGVEEQFYIFWPMVIVLSLKFFGRHGVKAVLSAVIIISIICSELLLKSNPSFSFYMLPARAWELAIGGLLGLSGNLGLQIKKSVAGVLVSAGILIVGYSIFFFEKTTPFPGLHALIPCIGAALIIFGGQFENLVSSFLCNVVMKYIGRISYPLYLVHWPIIVFWGLASTTEVSMAVKLVQIAVMFGAAHVLYAGVEPIFRRIPATRARMKVWAPMAMAPVIAMGLVCASMLFTNGLQGRHPMPAWVSQAAAESSSFQRDPCLMRGAEFSTSAQCVIGDPTRQPTLVLWGDSHATQLIPAFREIADANGYAGLIITKAGCAPIPDTTMLPNSEMRRDCRQFNSEAIERVAAIPKLKGLIVAGNWRTYLSGGGLLTDGDEVASPDGTQRIMADRFSRMREQLPPGGYKLILMGIAPTGENKAFSCASRAAYRNMDFRNCSSDLYSDTLFYQKDLEGLVGKNSKIDLVDYLPVMCPDQKYCAVYNGRNANFLDDSHISAHAAKSVVSTIEHLL
ncbi:acyltransferase family protein [Sphingomonas sp. LH128]|uniref:acyltransferase family protein n=1 Tax=Sphingomonas sp. LH128 TaxID=473781 RepID=UPI000306EEAE|nr:acyltransferase family protein [Sphingomonas sp. LH128]